MRHLSLLVSIISITAITTGCASTEQSDTAALQPQPPATQPPAMMTATPAEIEAGKHIVELRCKSCHSVSLDTPSRHSEAPQLPRLSEEYPVLFLEEAFAEGILVGHPDMPVIKLPPEEIRALLGYLDSIQVNRGT